MSGVWGVRLLEAAAQSQTQEALAPARGASGPWTSAEMLPTQRGRTDGDSVPLAVLAFKSPSLASAYSVLLAFALPSASTFLLTVPACPAGRGGLSAVLVLSATIPINESVSHSVMSVSLASHGLCLCPWNSLGKNTGVGCHSLFHGIFPTQGSNLGLLHWRQILYRLSHQGSLATHRAWANNWVSNSLSL